MVSQVEVGHANNLTLQVTGDAGSLVAKLGRPRQLLRPGNDYLGDATLGATRLPAGHPEGFVEAFANVYGAIAEAIARHAAGEDPVGDYPSIDDGARGVRFIETTVASARSDAKWTPFPYGAS